MPIFLPGRPRAGTRKRWRAPAPGAALALIGACLITMSASQAAYADGEEVTPELAAALFSLTPGEYRTDTGSTTRFVIDPDGTLTAYYSNPDSSCYVDDEGVAVYARELRVTSIELNWDPQNHPEEHRFWLGGNVPHCDGELTYIPTVYQMYVWENKIALGSAYNYYRHLTPPAACGDIADTQFTVAETLPILVAASRLGDPSADEMAQVIADPFGSTAGYDCDQEGSAELPLRAALNLTTEGWVEAGDPCTFLAGGIDPGAAEYAAGISPGTPTGTGSLYRSTGERTTWGVNADYYEERTLTYPDGTVGLRKASCMDLRSKFLVNQIRVEAGVSVGTSTGHFTISQAICVAWDDVNRRFVLTNGDASVVNGAWVWAAPNAPVMDDVQNYWVALNLTKQTGGPRPGIASALLDNNNRRYTVEAGVIQQAAGVFTPAGGAADTPNARNITFKFLAGDMCNANRPCTEVKD